MLGLPSPLVGKGNPFRRNSDRYWRRSTLTSSQLRLTWPRLRRALKNCSNSCRVKAVQMPTVGPLTSSFVHRKDGNVTGRIKACQRNFTTSSPKWARRYTTRFSLPQSPRTSTVSLSNFWKRSGTCESKSISLISAGLRPAGRTNASAPTCFVLAPLVPTPSSPSAGPSTLRPFAADRAAEKPDDR